MPDAQVRKLQALLARKIAESETTQPEVETAVGWEAGTIARFLADEEELLLSQLFILLRAIRVDPADFFAELSGQAAGALPAKLRALKALVVGVVNLLVKNDVITADALASSVASQALAAERPPRGHEASPQAPPEEHPEAEAAGS